MSINIENNEQLECLVCLEPLAGVELACNHLIHARCLALSGQDTCSVCRRQHTFSADLQPLYEEHVRLNNEERMRREQQESIALARRLQREQPRDNNEEVQEINVQRLRINNRNFFITLRDSEDAIDYMDLMLQVNSIMHNINSNTTRFEVDRRAFQLYTLIIKVNEISATTGCNLQQIWSIIENTQ